MITSQSTSTAAEDTARKALRAAGYQVTPIGTPDRRDHEFAALTFRDPRGTAAAVDLITRPASHVEVQRIHTGRPATRIYVQWAR
jgi:hypothetical protein